MLKYYTAKAIRWSYSTVEAASQALSMVLSVLGLVKEPTPGNIAGASAAALAVFVSEGTESYQFQGPEIEENILGTEHNEQNQSNQVTLKRQVGYGMTKYGYIFLTLGYDCCQYIFLYSTTKAIINNLQTGMDEPIAYVSPGETLGIVGYYVVVKGPSSLTNKLPQASKNIMQSFGISPDQAFDKAFSDKLMSLARPLAQKEKFRSYIRSSLTFQHTVEEVLPIVLIVPTPLIRQIIEGPVLFKAIAGIAAPTILTTLILTMGANVYCFEGNFSVAFLKAIAGIPQNDIKPWVNPTVSKIFMKLLFLCGLIHGSGIALDVLQGLKEFDAPVPLIYSLSALSFTIAWIGNHFSEVKTSQKVLAQLTLGSDQTESHTINSPLSLFFKKSQYGAIKTTYENYPTNLLKPIPEEDLALLAEEGGFKL